MLCIVHGKERFWPKLKTSGGLFLLLLFLHAAAPALSQELTFSFSKTPLEKVFRELEKHTPYRFVYTKEVLLKGQPVTINVRGTQMKTVLERIFEGQPLSYKLDGHYVLIREKALTESDKTVVGLLLIEVKGKVTNEEGDPLPGVTITLKSNYRMVVTDGEGDFTIPGVHPADVLVVSSVGYTTKEVHLNGRTSLEIRLVKAVNTLDEAIVIAYGTTTRRRSTGNVSRVDADLISRQPVANPIAALQGLVPGFFVTQANGLPGANIEVKLRGLNSLKQGTQPLFIVDGVPYMLNSGVLGQLSLTNNNILNNINPLDIESIEVLKDADATAIYGSQGANGVVLITTKRGKNGKTAAHIAYHTGVGKVTRTLDLLNTPQYLHMRREAFKNDGITPTLSTAPDLLLWDSTRYTDWKRMLIGNPARTQNLQASLSGGSLQTQFLFSTNYYNEVTVFPGRQPYQRFTNRLQASHASADRRFRANAAASYSVDQKSLPLNDLTSYIYLPPNAPALYDESGNLAWTAGIENPMSYLMRRYEAQNSNLVGSANFQYSLSNGIILKTFLGYNSLWLSEEGNIPIKAQRPSSTTTGSAQWANATAANWSIEPVAEYSFSLPHTSVTLIAGASLQSRMQKSNAITGIRYMDDDLLGNMAAAGQLQVSNSASQYKYAALFGRLSANYRQRYLLNLNIRRDGSSRFGPANRFSNFGAIGAAWIFSEEAPVKGLLRWLTYGKLRASAGITGNDQIGDYRYLDAWATATAYGYAGNTAGVLPTRPFNQNFEWEKVRKLEMGLELGLLKDRFLLSVAYFNNRSSNQLVSYKLPNITGFTSILRNLDAEIQNAGLELELSSKNMAHARFSWESAFNISFPRNRLLRYPGLEQSSDRYNYSIGQPLRIVYAYHYTGVDPQQGVYTFADLDRNGVISSPGDLEVAGTIEQDFFGGLTNRISYGNFELSFLLHFVKQTGRNYLATLSSVPGTLSNQPLLVLDRWQQPGNVTPLARFTATATTDAYRKFTNYRSSSALIEDASYLRLRNLHFSYTLTGALLHKVGLSRARLYAEGQNLFTLTKYKGSDPETQSMTALPPLKIVAAGIQITL